MIKIINIIPDSLRTYILFFLFAMLFDDRSESPMTSIASEAISSPRSKRNASAANVSTTPFTTPTVAPPMITVNETQRATVRFPKRPISLNFIL